MLRCTLFMLLSIVSAATAADESVPNVMNVCDLAKHLPTYRDKIVTVRGVFYYGLRQECPQSCASGVYPSFLDLASDKTAIPDEKWAELYKAQQAIEADAKAGKRLELWVTLTGRVRTKVRNFPFGPCNWLRPGYGHLSAYPSELVVTAVRDIEVRVNPNSSYDYANMYHGPL